MSTFRPCQVCGALTNNPRLCTPCTIEWKASGEFVRGKEGGKQGSRALADFIDRRRAELQNSTVKP